MAYLPDVIKIGNPLLRKQSIDVSSNEFGTHNLKVMQEQLFQIMQNENGIGLAAPQIGLNKRIIVFGIEDISSRTGEKIPYTLLINPTFEASSYSMEEDYEGCLSIGELRGTVPRFTHIGYRGYDINGNLIEREAKGLHARVVQHEIDHLDGILFIDRITNYDSISM